MAKLMKTTEEFQVSTRTEAEKLVARFQAENFPRLVSYEIKESSGQVILIVQKEFGIEFDEMKFD